MSRKASKQEQMTMAGTDTDFSRAADAYVDAYHAVKVAESEREAKMKVLVEEMRKKKIRTLKHGNMTLELRIGGKRADTVAIK